MTPTEPWNNGHTVRHKSMPCAMASSQLQCALIGNTFPASEHKEDPVQKKPPRTPSPQRARILPCHVMFSPIECFFCVLMNPPQSQRLEGSSIHRRAHGSSAQARSVRSLRGISARTDATVVQRTPLCYRGATAPPAEGGIVGEQGVICSHVPWQRPFKKTDVNVGLA